MKEHIENIIKEFLRLCEIPHSSHCEEAIGDYLCHWGEARSLTVRRDDMGNVIIDRPAVPGKEGAPLTILQAHMDMVCVAEPGVSYDPKTDPIRVIRTDNTLSADGTSLGADDGIGVAIALDILADNSLSCGPIRAIFTVNEEDGMASKDMESVYLEGDYLINLDWETQGSLCNSCAGGDFFRFARRAEWETVEKQGTCALRLTIDHLLGGHSGAEIHMGRTNAITALATALALLWRKGFSFRIADFSGGQAPNAIPRSAEAVIILDELHSSAAKQGLITYAATWRQSICNAEPGAQFSVEKAATPPEALSQTVSNDLIRLLLVAPDGIHTMSPHISGLVESSSNIGLVKLADTLEVTDFARSSSVLAAEQLEVQCASVAALCGFALHCDNRTPGWEVNPRSRLVPTACEAYQELTGEEMKVEPIHAGVECGAFARKNPKLDMISIGPTLRDVHTPQETCDIPSVGVTAELVRRILDEIVRESTHE